MSSSLKELSLAAICERLPREMIENVVENPHILQHLKDLLFFKVWAVYLIKHQKKGSALEDYVFLGAYSSEEKAQARVTEYEKQIPRVGVHKNILLHKLTVYEYLLDATKGKQLYRAWCMNSDYNFGPLPITNEAWSAFRPLCWAFPGCSVMIQKENKVTLDEDVEIS